MRSSRPPALATWLVEHLSRGGKNEALAGDLLEQFSQGRSVAWYWRQALIAIALNFVSKWRILALAGAFTTAWAFAFHYGLPKQGVFPQMAGDVRLVENVAGVQRAGVQDLRRTNFGGTRTRIFIVEVLWTGKSADEEVVADRVAKLILQNDPNVRNHDLLRVVMTRGYDLGIANAKISHLFEHTPAQWNAMSFGGLPADRSTPSQL
jgi:hypothetical protein